MVKEMNGNVLICVNAWAWPQ